MAKKEEQPSDEMAGEVKNRVIAQIMEEIKTAGPSVQMKGYTKYDQKNCPSNYQKGDGARD